jgi:hypothetical protein
VVVLRISRTTCARVSPLGPVQKTRLSAPASGCGRELDVSGDVVCRPHLAPVVRASRNVAEVADTDDARAREQRARVVLLTA